MVYGKGINDMPRGWTKVDEWNYRVYQVWQGMLKRCYSEKYHEKRPTYKDCTVCNRWLTLSNFVEDIVKIDNYEYWLAHPNQRVALDKDIKSNGENKEYNLKNCMFISNADNTKQANRTRNYDDMRGENHPNHGELVVQIDKITNKILNLRYNREYLGFNQSHISKCCKGKYKTHKDYIWKYISDCTDEQINEYIIRTKQIRIE